MSTIDKLGMTTIRQLRLIHELKNYRYACHVISHLKQYLHTTFFNREKVFYLNKNGRYLIDSQREITKTSQIEHYLLRNEAYIFYRFPFDWEMEKVIEFEVEENKSVHGIITNLKTIAKKKIVADAYFTRNGYTHIVEIDNTRDMKDNRQKVINYSEVLKNANMTKLELFTTTSNRKNKFEAWLKEFKVTGNVYLYNEIKTNID